MTESLYVKRAFCGNCGKWIMRETLVDDKGKQRCPLCRNQVRLRRRQSLSKNRAERSRYKANHIKGTRLSRYFRYRMHQRGKKEAGSYGE